MTGAISNSRHAELLRLLQGISDVQGKHTAAFSQVLATLKENRMATQADFDAVIKRIDDATNVIAKKLSDLSDQVKGMGLSADQEATIVSALQAEAAKLEGIGADPANPVPTP